jgi:adenine-specific DNA-methyltransferase
MSYRYIGNKARLLPELMGIITSCVPPDALVADPMCGTAGVAEALSENGFRVFASDIMTFAYLHARVRLTLSRAPRFKGLGGYRVAIQRLNTIAPVRNFFHREYSPAGSPRAGVPARGYFTPENAAKLDAMVYAIRQWSSDGTVSETETILLRHDLVLAANRVANIAGTYGHFRSKWSPSSLASIRLEQTRFMNHGTLRHCVRMGAAEQITQGLRADLCYLDPPYTKRQYAANYHMLETIARSDEPDAVGVSGLRPWRDQYSDFCSKLRVRDSFRAIIGGMDCPRFLVSYSEEGLLSREEMESVLGEFGCVSVHELEAKRFRSQRRKPTSTVVTEFVFDLIRD